MVEIFWTQVGVALTKPVNMFVRFVTDVGNYGLTGTTSDPGFWLEWQMVDGGEGDDCVS